MLFKRITATLVALILIILIFERIPFKIHRNIEVEVIANNEIVSTEYVDLKLYKYNRILKNDFYKGTIVVLDTAYQIETDDYSGLNDEGYPKVLYLQKLIKGELYSFHVIKYDEKNRVMDTSDCYIDSDVRRIIGTTTELKKKYGRSSYFKSNNSSWDENLVKFQYDKY